MYNTVVSRVTNMNTGDLSMGGGKKRNCVSMKTTICKVLKRKLKYTRGKISVRSVTFRQKARVLTFDNRDTKSKN